MWDGRWIAHVIERGGGRDCLHSPGVFTIAPGPRRRALVTGPACSLPGTGVLPRLVSVSGHGGEVSEGPLVAIGIGLSLDLHAARARFCLHHVDVGVRMAKRMLVGERASVYVRMYVRVHVCICVRVCPLGFAAVQPRTSSRQIHQRPGSGQRRRSARDEPQSSVVGRGVRVSHAASP